MSPERSYDGDPLDGTVQYLAEAPYWQGRGETVDVVDDEPVGQERTVGVPDVATDGGERRTGQTTLDEWRWDR